MVESKKQVIEQLMITNKLIAEYNGKDIEVEKKLIKSRKDLTKILKRLDNFKTNKSEVSNG